MRVLGVGEAVVDTTVIQGHTSLESFQKDASEPALSALILLAKLEASCHMIASLGDDAAWELVRYVLDEHQISLTSNNCSEIKQHTTGILQMKP